MSTESTFFCAETTRWIVDVASKFKSHEIVRSLIFSCPQDPNPALFCLRLEFYGDGLRVWLCALNRDVLVKAWNVSIADIDGNIVKTHTSESNKSREMGSAWGRTGLLPPVALPDLVWSCSCEIHYEGSSYGAIHVSRDFLELLEAETCADITFSVRGEEIKAHKAILVARSGYFAGMFQSKLTENSSGKIEVTDADPKVFRGMLEYLYGGLPPKQIDDIVLDLLVVADKYGIEGLCAICEGNLCAHLCAENVVDALILAERHNLRDLMTAAKAVFRANRDVVTLSEESRRELSQPLLESLVELRMSFISNN